MVRRLFRPDRRNDSAQYRQPIWTLRVVALAGLLSGAVWPPPRAVCAAITPQPQATGVALPAGTVEIKTPDGVILKGSYFPAARSGPGVLLFHQSNRDRQSWAGVARQLAEAGINTLTVDMRGYGDSPGRYDADRRRRKKQRADDLDAAFRFLVSQAGVKPDVIGIGGAGVLGVENSVDVARQHRAAVKSLVLISGETSSDGLNFLKQASQLPELFVVADADEYPPIPEAMELLYITASNPSRKFVHYSAQRDAPWLWYEPFDIGKVPPTGNHGTDLFKTHSELSELILDWLITTLIKSPGHAPADTLASATILNQFRAPGGTAHVAELLRAARRKDPQVQLFPEVTATSIGENYLRAGDPKSAIATFQLVLLAYPKSADAYENLAEAYLKEGRRTVARQAAEKALALLDAHDLPASSWTDTEPYRGEIRNGAETVLKALKE
jgi:dienelactone hydrolase